MGSDSKRVYWGLRTFCLITGASRGIGEEIAYQFAKKFKAGSVILLLSRTVSGLEAAKNRIQRDCPGIKVKVAPTDLYKPNNKEYYNLIVNTLKEHNVKPSDFEHAIVVHNAGVMCKANTATADDLQMLHDDINVNLHSTISLNVQFLKVFTKDTVGKRSVIQTSSIASVMPLPNMGLYCMAKAARNMYFQTLAIDDPTLDIFSYGPGPVDTEMARTSGFDNVDPRSLEKLKESGFLLSCDATVKWLVDVLTEGNYKSGEFRDIYTMEKYITGMSSLMPNDK